MYVGVCAMVHVVDRRQLSVLILHVSPESCCLLRLAPNLC